MRIFVIVCVMCVGFVGGIVWERTANNVALNDIEQIAQEACDVRIKIIKETCKK